MYIVALLHHSSHAEMRLAIVNMSQSTAHKKPATCSLQLNSWTSPGNHALLWWLHDSA